MYTEYCLERIDGTKQPGSSDTLRGTLSINTESGYLTIPDLPIGKEVQNLPGLVRTFNEPVTLRAVVFILRLPKPTVAPEKSQSSTSPRQTKSKPIQVAVTFQLSTRKPGDATFADVIDHATGKSKVNEYFDRLIMINQRVIAIGETETVFTDENIKQTYGGRLTILQKTEHYL